MLVHQRLRSRDAANRTMGKIIWLVPGNETNAAQKQLTGKCSFSIRRVFFNHSASPRAGDQLLSFTAELSVGPGAPGQKGKQYSSTFLWYGVFPLTKVVESSAEMKNCGPLNNIL